MSQRVRILRIEEARAVRAWWRGKTVEGFYYDGSHPDPVIPTAVYEAYLRDMRKEPMANEFDYEFIVSVRTNAPLMPDEEHAIHARVTAAMEPINEGFTEVRVSKCTLVRSLTGAD